MTCRRQGDTAGGEIPREAENVGANLQYPSLVGIFFNLITIFFFPRRALGGDCIRALRRWRGLASAWTGSSQS